MCCPALPRGSSGEVSRLFSDAVTLFPGSVQGDFLSF